MNFLHPESNDFYGDIVSPRRANEAHDHQERHEAEAARNGNFNNTSDVLKKDKEEESKRKFSTDVRAENHGKETIDETRSKANKKHSRVGRFKRLLAISRITLVMQ